MKNEIVEYTPQIEKEILDLVQDIPFENSFVQTRSVIDSSITPEKAYKTIGLRLMKRLQDLKVCGVKHEQTLNEIEILRYHSRKAIEKDGEELGGLHAKKFDLEILEKTAGFDYSNKLADDCKSELNYLYSLLKKFPKAYTREEFEEGEQRWLDIKLKELSMGIQDPKTQGMARMLEQGHIVTVPELQAYHSNEQERIALAHKAQMQLSK